MQQTTGNSISSTPETQGSTREAPPKQVAQAMDRLGLATRLIADIRLGADRLLEALIMAGQPLQSNSSKPLQFIIKEEASLRQSLQDLRTIGRQLEDSGVLNESLRSRSNSWGLHMPLVCPDGAVVAYAWKRQLAGQAGASAVDRTRLALKAFTDQKRRFFPHLDDDSGAESAPKRHCSTRTSTSSDQDEINDFRTVLDVLSRLEKEVPNVKTFTYRRLDWLKRASLLPSSSCETSAESLKEEHNFRGLDTLRQGLANAIAADQIAVIELLFPSVFRVVISLHPVGSLDPDAVAFFSPDEGGSYIHARGFSVFNVFKHITEHAAMALQHFTGIKAETALYMLLLWICSYETLFTKVCSKCGKLLSMDKESALLLPPVQRPYRNFSAIAQLVSSQQHSSTKDPNQMTMIRSTPSYTTLDQIINGVPAYHIGCFSEES